MNKLCFHFVAVLLYCITIATSELAAAAEQVPLSGSKSAFGSASGPASSSASASASGYAQVSKSLSGLHPGPPPPPAPAGVGMLLASDKPGYFVVQYILPDMPAAKANVKVGDVILAVDGALVDNVKTVQELVDKIRGASGSTVKIKVRSGDKTRDIALVRGMIPTVKSSATDDFRREVSVYFYQYEDLIPEQPGTSAIAYRYGFASDQTVRDFLRKQLTRRYEH